MLKSKVLNQTLWFVGLWIAGVLAVAVIAEAFRLLARLAMH